MPYHYYPPRVSALPKSLLSNKPNAMRDELQFEPRNVLLQVDNPDGIKGHTNSIWFWDFFWLKHSELKTCKMDTF